MVLCMNSMILGGCIPSPKKQTEPITVEKNPNMMYMLVGSYATPDEEGIKVYNFYFFCFYPFCFLRNRSCAVMHALGNRTHHFYFV